MARTIKPATAQDVQDVRSALVALKHARRLLAKAKADRALERVRDAIASAEGAERHVTRRFMDTLPATITTMDDADKLALAYAPIEEA
jgi:hypothetical protein